MEDPKLAIISAIARDIERRLSVAGPSQPPILRALLESMLLACPQDPEIRLEIETFTQALIADLEWKDGKVIPISPAVAAIRGVELLRRTARLRAFLDALRT